MKAARGWLQALNRRALRERVLIGASVLVIELLLFELVLLQPLGQARADAEQTLGTVRTDQQLRHARHAELAAALERREREQGSIAAQALVQENARLDTLLQRETVPTISPAEMVAVLREMFAADEAVTLIVVENGAARPVLPLASAAPEPQAQSVARAPLPRLYEHPLTLEFTGSFAKIVEYLKRMETLDWQLIWDDFTIVMERYPIARARVVLHTLSLRREWIGA